MTLSLKFRKYIAFITLSYTELHTHQLYIVSHIYCVLIPLEQIYAPVPRNPISVCVSQQVQNHC